MAFTYIKVGMECWQPFGGLSALKQLVKHPGKTKISTFLPQAFSLDILDTGHMAIVGKVQIELWVLRLSSLDMKPSLHI